MGHAMHARRRARGRSKVEFSELSRSKQLGLGLLGVVQVSLLVAAQLDIQRRPADQIVGRKAWWRLICLINIIGPLSYFRWGRRRPEPERPQPPSDPMKFLGGRRRVRRERLGGGSAR